MGTHYGCSHRAISEFLLIQPKGFPMYANSRQVRTAAFAPLIFQDNHGDTSLRSGGMRAVIMNYNDANPDKNFGMACAIRESIEQAFGKIPLDVQLEADRNAYEMKAI